MEVLREFTDEDGDKCRELLVEYDELDSYCDPETLGDWSDRVISIDYSDEDDAYIIIVSVDR